MRRAVTFTASLVTQKPLSQQPGLPWDSNLQLSALTREDRERRSWLLFPSSQSCISLTRSSVPWPLCPFVTAHKARPGLSGAGQLRLAQGGGAEQAAGTGWVHSSETCQPQPGCAAAAPSCGNLLSLLPPLQAHGRYLEYRFRRKETGETRVVLVRIGCCFPAAQEKVVWFSGKALL